MFGSQILEIAIGMVFVYLSLSLVCSGINEWIANIFQLRAGLLEEWLREQLTEPGSKDYYEEFQAHPLIKALYQKPSSNSKLRSIPLVGRLFRTIRKPSYIPSRTFVLAFLDVVAPIDTQAGSRTIDSIRTSVALLPNPDIQKTIFALIDGAGNDAEKVRENIEGWFDDAMERLSGWYKQRTKLVVLGLAIIVTLALNVNSIQVFNSLYHDGTVRAAVVAAAQQATQQSAAAGTQPSVTRIEQIQQELEKLNIPFGWTDPKMRPDTHDLSSMLLALVGWVLTALAVSQGAPFWFDVLNKLVNVRTSGARPPTTPATETVRPQVIVQPTIQTPDAPEPLNR
jgi:hypothetical protein